MINSRHVFVQENITVIVRAILLASKENCIDSKLIFLSSKLLYDGFIVT